MDDREQERIAEDFKFIKMTAGWPYWPTLPMKRNWSHKDHAGFLFESEMSNPPRIYAVLGVNLYDTEAAKQAIPRAVEDQQPLTDEEIMHLLTKEEWRVD
jgi:hypothetical protein